jgi:serine/threonine protein kinase
MASLLSDDNKMEVSFIQTEQILLDVIKPIKLIGQRGEAKVYSALWPNKYGNQLLALKLIDRDEKNDEKQKKDLGLLVEISEQLIHPFITKLLAYGVSDKYIGLVYNIHKCKSLYDLLSVAKTFTETRAKTYIREIVIALDFIHKKNIIYNDLKLENVMINCTSPGVDEHIVIIDLGGACYANKCESTVGTMDYFSPERIDDENDTSFSSDIWALGILTYELIAGTTPFYHEDEEVTKTSILNVEYIIPSNWSKPLKDFLTNIFQEESASRPSAEKLLTHIWLN